MNQIKARPNSLSLLAFNETYSHPQVSLEVQKVKNLPAMKKNWVQFLCWGDPLKNEMASPPVFMPGESHGQKSLAGYSTWGHKALDMVE